MLCAKQMPKRNVSEHMYSSRSQPFETRGTLNKFCLSVADHHSKLRHGKLQKLACLCVYILAK